MVPCKKALGLWGLPYQIFDNFVACVELRLERMFISDIEEDYHAWLQHQSHKVTNCSRII